MGADSRAKPFHSRDQTVTSRRPRACARGRLWHGMGRTALVPAWENDMRKLFWGALSAMGFALGASAACGGGTTGGSSPGSSSPGSGSTAGGSTSSGAVMGSSGGDQGGCAGADSTCDNDLEMPSGSSGTISVGPADASADATVDGAATDASLPDASAPDAAGVVLYCSDAGGSNTACQCDYDPTAGSIEGLACSIGGQECGVGCKPHCTCTGGVWSHCVAPPCAVPADM